MTAAALPLDIPTPKFPPADELAGAWLQQLLGDAVPVHIGEFPPGWPHRQLSILVEEAGGPAGDSPVVSRRRVVFRATGGDAVPRRDVLAYVQAALRWDAPPPSTSWFWISDTASPTDDPYDATRTARVYTVLVGVRATR